MDTAWVALIEASLEELFELSSQGGYYAEILLAFFRGDAEGLRARIRAGGAPSAGLQALAELRLDIVRGRVDSTRVALLSECMAREPELEGETLFLIGTARQIRSEFREAAQAFERAASALAREGAVRKSIRARAGRIACLSCMEPERNFLAEYFEVLRGATLLKEHATTATALTNIAREYQRMGALNAAIKLCNRAMVFVKRDLGGLAFDRILLTRCHILLDAGMLAEAASDLEMLRASGFAEIREAAKLISPRITQAPSGESIERELLHASWKERLDAEEHLARHAPRLGDAEDRLVYTLSLSPRTRAELRDSLFARGLSRETRDERLKSLLERVRRKFPGLIQLREGRYSLSAFTPLRTSAPRKRKSA